MKRIVAVLLLTALVAGALPAQPVPPENRVSELFFKSLEASHEALKQYGAWDNQAELERVNRLGHRVARETGFSKYPFSFYLIDMPEPNAFALPGGQIFVTRGMLEVGLSDDALAALLGHEIGHVVREHGTRMQRRATLLNILSQALMAGVLIYANQQNNDRYNPNTVPDPYGVERSGSSTGDLVQGTYAASMIVGELLLRSYSREFEDEADEVGQRTAANAGYDPEGTQRLMAQLGSRLPQSKEYGYWRTHPFFEDRVQAAKARGVELRRLEPRADDAFRQENQRQLLAYLPALPKSDLAVTLKEAALNAWPVGEQAESLRIEKLHRERRAELDRPTLARDYGRLLAAYDDQIAVVTRLTPESAFVRTLREEREELDRVRADLYPQALGVWKSGIYETPFLETFLSNYPQAGPASEVAGKLGEAYSRLGRQPEAVEQLLRAWRTAPAGSEQAVRMAAGLRRLVPVLDKLAALGELAEQVDDPELGAMARERLAMLAGTYGDIADGADYLRRFPAGEHAATVGERLNVLAMNLYGEVVLYQGIGDSLKALERIQRILTHAPTSPAAARLREKVLVEG